MPEISIKAPPLRSFKSHPLSRARHFFAGPESRRRTTHPCLSQTLTSKHIRTYPDPPNPRPPHVRGHLPAPLLRLARPPTSRPNDGHLPSNHSVNHWPISTCLPLLASLSRTSPPALRSPLSSQTPASASVSFTSPESPIRVPSQLNATFSPVVCTLVKRVPTRLS